MIRTFDPAHSAVTFSAQHMMITTVRGSMKVRDFDLSFDPENLEGSSVRVSLDAASIDTGQEARDQHLVSDDFLRPMRIRPSISRARRSSPMAIATPCMVT